MTRTSLEYRTVERAVRAIEKRYQALHAPTPEPILDELRGARRELHKAMWAERHVLNETYQLNTLQLRVLRYLEGNPELAQALLEFMDGKLEED